MHNKDYWKVYYSRNKDRLNKLKRWKYYNDGKYKDLITQSVRLQNKIKLVRDWFNTNTVEVNGRKETVLTLNRAAPIIGRDYSVLLKLINRGGIPAPTVKLSKKKNTREYTMSQILYMRDILNKVARGDLDLTYKELHDELLKVWDKPHPSLIKGDSDEN